MYFNYNKTYHIMQSGGKIMIIGICGNSGSGKSTLSRIIQNNYKEKGLIINIDEIGHKVLEFDEVKKEISIAFGNEVIKENKVNRTKLGDLVFTSRNEMQKLTDITWKYMQKEIDNIIEENKEKVIILDWILLPITKYFNMCNIKILLDVPYEIRQKRAIKRDNITKEAFDTREKASIQYKKEDFDYCIKDYTEETIRKMVLKI